jgi:hypothetical protein
MLWIGVNFFQSQMSLQSHYDALICDLLSGLVLKSTIVSELKAITNWMRIVLFNRNILTTSAFKATLNNIHYSKIFIQRRCLLINMRLVQE